MQHPEQWPLIDDYAESQLPAEAAARLAAHLSACPDCTARLHEARRQVEMLRVALVPSEPPAGFLQNVLSALPAHAAASRKRVSLAVLAGVAGNLITAAVLLFLSLGSGASVAVMLLVALVGAIAWGSLKGLAFAWLLRFLPGRRVMQGMLFGLVLWSATNLVLAIFGGFSSGSQFSGSFLLAGSLIHDLLYGLLVSLLYTQLAQRMREVVP